MERSKNRANARNALAKLLVLAMLLPAFPAHGQDFDRWDPTVRQQRARVQLAAGQFDELKKEIKALKLLAPEDDETIALECRLLASQKKWSRIVEMVGVSAEVRLIRARALVALDRANEAEKILEKLTKASDLAPALQPEAWEVYGDLAVSEKKKEAETYYRKAFALAPENQNIATKLADVMAAAGKAKQAADFLKPFAERPSADANLQFRYVSLLEQSGQVALAGRTLQAWIAQRPDVRWQELSYAALLEQMGEEDAASALKQKWNVKNLARPESTVRPKVKKPDPVRSVRVKRGDTLQSISEQLYGTTKRWKDIRSLNISALGRDSQIVPGMKLKVPPAEDEETEDEDEEAPTPKPEAKRNPSSFLTSPSETAPVAKPIRAQAMREEEGIEGPPAVESPSAQPLSFATLPPSEKEKVKGYVWASAGPRSAGNSLAARGFQANVTPDLGFGQAVASALMITPLFGLNLSAARSSSTYSALPGLNPSRIVVSERTLNFGAAIGVGQISKAAWLRNLILGMGWQMQKRDATATTPNVVISAYRASGLKVSLESREKIAGKFSGQLRASIFLPNSYAERNTNTGRFQSARGFEFEAMGLYPIFDNLQATAGLSHQNFRASFSDSGNRGSSGATETSKAWIFPVGVQWDY